MQDNYSQVAILVNNCTDTIINALMIVAMLIGFVQTRHLDFIQNKADQHEPEAVDLTMIITAFGMFAYATFTIIAGVLNHHHHLHEPGELVVTNGIVELLEVCNGNFDSTL